MLQIRGTCILKVSDLGLHCLPTSYKRTLCLCGLNNHELAHLFRSAVTVIFHSGGVFGHYEKLNPMVRLFNCQQNSINNTM